MVDDGEGEPDRPFFLLVGLTVRPQSPGVTWASSLPPRGSGGGPAWLTATELQDREDVLQDKVRERGHAQVRYVAKLLQCSRRTLLYTGAGVSTGSGVRQTARGSGGEPARSTEASPGLVHRALVLLTRWHTST